MGDLVHRNNVASDAAHACEEAREPVNGDKYEKKYPVGAGCHVGRKTLLLVGGLLAFSFLLKQSVWNAIGKVFEVRIPGLHLERFKGNVTSCLANPAHALGEGDLRIAFTKTQFDVLDWKLKLVHEARDSILFADVLGGYVLDLLGEILEEKVKRIPHFKVVVLHYAREELQFEDERLVRLAATYPDRFHYFAQSQVVGAEKIHIKAVVADYGKYFTLGGSVFMDHIVYYCYDSDFIFEDCSGKFGPKLWDDIVAASVSFVRTLADKHREHGLNVDKLLSAEEWTSSSLCAQNAAKGAPCDFSNHCDGFRNMSIPIPTPKIYYSGPGRSHNEELVDDMVEAITNSRSRIVIAQKYFTLPERLKNALQNAAIRGVRILIVTQGDGGEDSVLRSLASTGISASNGMDAVGILAKGRGNVKVYKFLDHSKLQHNMKSYHKKVVIVDDVLFGGSPNMGPKSMLYFIDLEVAFRVQSKALADEYDGTIVYDAENYSKGVHGVSYLQVILAYIWHVVRSFTTFANY